jgi:hypothetical protein
VVDLDLEIDRAASAPLCLREGGVEEAPADPRAATPTALPASSARRRMAREGSPSAPSSALSTPSVGRWCSSSWAARSARAAP